MRLNHAPQAVCLDQLATPLSGAYAFEAVQYKGDQERIDRSTGEPVDVWQPMSDIVDGLHMAKLHDSLERRFWYPARTVRGVMDYMSHEDASYLPLLSQAARVAVQMYANPKICDELDAFGENVERSKLDEAVVYHKGDVLTTTAEDLMYSQAAAAKIAREIGAPALFLANCHGGLIPTIQTALTYERDHPGNRLVPIKFSMHKAKSRWPQMLPEELRLITEASEDMPIVVYDDDACGGDTMKSLVRYLTSRLPKNRSIAGYVSYDDREPHLKKSQGEHWEHCKPSASSTFMCGSF